MTDKLELLARVQSLSTDYNFLPRGGKSGKDELMQMLIGLRGGPLYLALARYMGDANSANMAYRLLQRRHLRTPPNLISLALIEIIEPQLCRNCSGRGIIYPRRSAAVDCPKCDGVGNRNFTDRDRAKSLGLSGKAYKRIANSYENGPYHTAIVWLNQAIEHIQKKL